MRKREHDKAACSQPVAKRQEEIQGHRHQKVAKKAAWVNSTLNMALEENF